MSTGFSVPVKSDVSGGAAKTHGAEQTKKLLKLALSEGDDDNPFQDLGIHPNIIFALNDVATTAEVKLEVERILRKFTNRIALDPSNPIKFKRENPGELEMSFGYIDLETNTREEFRQLYSRAGGQRG